jgi:hypothetical protein
MLYWGLVAHMLDILAKPEQHYRQWHKRDSQKAHAVIFCSNFKDEACKRDTSQAVQIPSLGNPGRAPKSS